MKINLSPLTSEQSKQLTTWGNDPDPAARLFSNYYQWKKIALMHDYFQAVNAANDLDEKEDARLDFNAVMHELRARFLNDLEFYFEMLAAMNNTFLPEKIRVSFEPSTNT